MSIKIESEPGEWASYWDKLASKTAANDTPDIIQMDQKYIAEYGEQAHHVLVRFVTVQAP